MLYVGVDAHKASSQITVVDEAGRILARAKVSSTLSAFRKALSAYDEPLTGSRGKLLLGPDLRLPC